MHANNKAAPPLRSLQYNSLANNLFLAINNSLFILDSFKYSDIYSNGNINVQEIQFTNKMKKENNEIVEITFYYNKDLIIKKIMKGVLG